ncbi:MAG: ABC transporter ATP-binding protein [Bacilli bacterium]|jgi:oligopeptide transport system ATP-binding protein|nr:ABC transporter ATP-binding protein [Bacilli bacterium]
MAKKQIVRNEHYEHLLEVKDLHVSFKIMAGKVEAVNGVSYTLDKGKILGIVGESGSGKSVSSYSIMRILDKNGTIDKGQILFEGEDLTKASEKRMQEIRGNRIAMIFQDPMTGLNPVYTIGNQLMEAVRTHHKDMDKKDIYKKCVDMLTLVGFNEPVKRMKQYPFEFSGGMLQRAMIAMALVCDPDLLIADEPTTALDVTIQAQILDLLKSIQEKLGMAIIIITHDLGVVAQICDEVDVMYAGRVVERGTADEIFYNPQHEYTKGLLESVPTLKDKDLHPIKGNPINLLALPKGCPFSPRCDHCMKICIEKYPESLQINDQHIVSCWNAVKALQDKGEIDVMAAPDPEKVKEEEELAEHDPSTQKKMSVLLKGLVSDKDKKEDSNV